MKQNSTKDKGETTQLELQNMQAKMMHYETMASRAHQEFEEQPRAAAEEVQRVTLAANAERQKLSFQMDHEVKSLQRSMTETLEKQKGTLFDEFRTQKEQEDQALQQRLAETLKQQRTSLFSEFHEERNRMTSDNAQLQSHLEQMRAMMAEVQKQVTGFRTQVASQAR